MKKKLFIFLVFLLIVFIVRITTIPVGHSQVVHLRNQEGYYDYQGVIHFHTNYSGDATGTFEEIARIANEQKVDFLISTDHNTLRPLEDKKEGWYQNTLVLAGEELSLPEGYLLVLNVQNLKRVPEEKTEEIISDAVKQGGILFIAHPDHPKWRWKMEEDRGLTGEEVLDFAD
ncbi:MAG: PHP domain-containing protein, partial [Nitrospiria bacterium]